eukprot:7817946-Alexandrium_andersonii.AAC.1
MPRKSGTRSPGHGPILPIHVLRDPSPPGTPRIHLLGRVETLDGERRGVEVFRRSRNLSLAGALVDPVHMACRGAGLNAHPPAGVMRSEAHRTRVRRPNVGLSYACGA